MRTLRYYSALILCASILACTKDSEQGKEEKFEKATYTVSGKVEKGPFVSGSTINLQPLNASYAPVGTNFHGEIVDNAGNFNLGQMELDTPYANMTANGYFYNEVEDQLSNGTLTLNAVVDLRNKSTVNVNILTHLKYYRVQKLLASGKAFADADKQAQEELMKAFGLEKYNTTDFSQYSIVSGTDQAACLIAISSLLLVDRKEAEITEYLAKISKEFGDNGEFSAATKEQIKNDRFELVDRLHRIANHIEEKYTDLDQKVTVKDLAYYFDWNDDGIAGNEISDKEDVVTLEKTSVEFPREGGKMTISFTSEVPVSLEPYGTDPNEYPITSYYDNYFDMGNISFDAKLNDKSIEITVSEAEKLLVSPASVNLYDYRNRVVASIEIKQQGNPNGQIFAAKGNAIIDYVKGALSQAIGYAYQLDGSFASFNADSGSSASFTSDDTRIYTIWSGMFSAIRRVGQIFDMVEEQGQTEALENITYAGKTLYSLLYYKMLTFWGAVPYITDEMRNSMTGYYSRTEVPELNQILIADLTKAIELLEQKKNDVEDTSADAFVTFSKDVPRFILAKVYMTAGGNENYQKALDLLKRIDDFDYYMLSKKEKDNIESFSSDEIIFRIYNPSTKADFSIYDGLFVLTYPDLLLSLSECYAKLGDMVSATVYLNKIRESFDEPALITFSSFDEAVRAIQPYRKLLLKMATGEYFDFLKRAGLAKEMLNIQDYQLLLPIPRRELEINPGMTQNPGY